MSETANFRINVNQFLGQKNAEYRDSLYSLALSSPKEYFEFRKKASEFIRTEALKNLYNVIYDALNTGMRYEGRTTTKPLGTKMPDGGPQVSEKIINEIALSASKTLNSILDEVMEHIAPLDYKTIANQRYKVAGEASQILT